MKTEIGGVTFIDRDSGLYVKMPHAEFLRRLGWTDEMQEWVRTHYRWTDEEIPLNDPPKESK